MKKAHNHSGTGDYRLCVVWGTFQPILSVPKAHGDLIVNAAAELLDLARGLEAVAATAIRLIPEYTGESPLGPGSHPLLLSEVGEGDKRFLQDIRRLATSHRTSPNDFLNGK